MDLKSMLLVLAIGGATGAHADEALITKLGTHVWTGSSAGGQVAKVDFATGLWEIRGGFDTDEQRFALIKEGGFLFLELKREADKFSFQKFIAQRNGRGVLSFVRLYEEKQQVTTPSEETSRYLRVLQQISFSERPEDGVIVFRIQDGIKTCATSGAGAFSPCGEARILTFELKPVS